MDSSDLLRVLTDESALKDIIKLDEYVYNTIFIVFLKKLKTSNILVDKIFSIDDDDVFMILFPILYENLPENFYFDHDLFLQLNSLRQNLYLKVQSLSGDTINIDEYFIENIKLIHYDALIDYDIWLSHRIQFIRECDYTNYVDYLIFLNGTLDQVNKLYDKHNERYSIEYKVKLSVNICKNINISDEDKIKIALKLCS
jgi:hypothetical protein